MSGSGRQVRNNRGHEMRVDQSWWLAQVARHAIAVRSTRGGAHSVIAIAAVAAW
jgi:hypothetical protein